MKSLAGTILRLLGWKYFEPPQRPARAVLIAYPHTSNWDAFYGLLGNAALGLNVRWVAKDTAFRWPFAGLMRRMGGIPVNRRERTDFVAQMVRELASSPTFILGITPEGTRSLTAGWKSGFYRIALAAGVPVAVATIDYARKELGIMAYVELSGDRDADLARIAACYGACRGRRHQFAAPIRWLDQADH